MNDLVITAPATPEAFAAELTARAPLPWTFGTNECAGTLFDANNDPIGAIDIWAEQSDADAITVAALIVLAVNLAGGHPAIPAAAPDYAFRPGRT